MIEIKLIKEITDKTPDLNTVEDLQNRILGAYNTWNPSTPEGRKYKEDIANILGVSSLTEENEKL